MLFSEILNSVYTLTASSIDLLRSVMSEKSYKKNSIIIRQETFDPNVYLLKKGCVRAYYYKEDQEITSWFAFEGEIVFTSASFQPEALNKEIIEAVEDCEFYILKRADLRRFFCHNNEIANWGRRLAEISLLFIEHQLHAIKFHSAKERYEDLIKHYPLAIRRLKLGHIASYIGVSQVTLSRIRSEI